MLENGTTPAPIIVAKNAHNIKNHRGREMYMKVPFQLIEGHMRLAYLRGMIKQKHPKLKDEQEVWEMKIPLTAVDV